VGDDLAHSCDRLADAPHQGDLLVVQEEGPQERTGDAVTEKEMRGAQVGGELLGELRRQLNVRPQQSVPAVDGV
jgi:hypothetical protein